MNKEELLKDLNTYLTPEKMKQISAELQQFTNDNKLLDEKFEELVKAHPMKWAVMHKGELTIAESYDDFLKNHRNTRCAATRWLNPKPPTMILYQSHKETLH